MLPEKEFQPSWKRENPNSANDEKAFILRIPYLSGYVLVKGLGLANGAGQGLLGTGFSSYAVLEKEMQHGF